MHVMRFRDEMVKNSKTITLLLMGGVLFVHLIACANVANLLLARAASRTREIAIRRALGATRSSVLRMIVGEGAAVAAAGLVLGIAIAAVGTGAIMTLTFGVDRLDVTSIAAAASLLVSAMLAACLVAARRGISLEPTDALRWP